MREQFDNNRWRPPADVVAVRISAKAVRGALFRNLIVVPGQLVAFEVDGRFITFPDGESPTGDFKLSDAGERLAKAYGLRNANAVHAYLFREARFSVPFAVDNLFTSDLCHVQVHGQFEIQFRAADIAARTLLMSSETVQKSEIVARFQGAIEQAADAWTSQRTANTLTPTEPARIHLETAILDITQHRLALLGLRGFGLQDAQIRVLPLGDSIDTPGDSEATLQAWRTLDDSTRQALTSQVRQIHADRLHNLLEKRMRQEIMSAEFDRLNDDQARAESLLAKDVHNLLNAAARARIKRAIDWRNDDDMRRRAETLKVEDFSADLRHQTRAFAISQIQFELQRTTSSHARQLEREEIEDRLLLEAMKQVAEHERARLEAAHKRELEGENALAARKRSVADELNKIDIQLKQLPLHQKQMELENRRQKLALELHDLEVRLKHKREHQRELDALEADRIRQANWFKARYDEIDLRARARNLGVDFPTGAPGTSHTIRRKPTAGPLFVGSTWHCSKCSSELTPKQYRCPTCLYVIDWSTLS